MAALRRQKLEEQNALEGIALAAQKIEDDALTAAINAELQITSQSIENQRKAVEDNKLKRCVCTGGVCDSHCYCRSNIKKERGGRGIGGFERCSGACGCDQDECTNRYGGMSGLLPRVTKAAKPSTKKLESHNILIRFVLLEAETEIDDLWLHYGHKLQNESGRSSGDEEWDIKRCKIELCQKHPGALALNTFIEVDFYLSVVPMMEWDMNGNVKLMHEQLLNIALIVAKSQPRVAQALLANIFDVRRRHILRPDLNLICSASPGGVKEVYIETLNALIANAVGRVGQGKDGNVESSMDDYTIGSASAPGASDAKKRLNMNKVRQSPERQELYEKFKRKSYEPLKAGIKSEIIAIYKDALSGALDGKWLPVSAIDRGLPALKRILKQWEKKSETRAKAMLIRLSQERESELKRVVAVKESWEAIVQGGGRGTIDLSATLGVATMNDLSSSSSDDSSGTDNSDSNESNSDESE